MTAWAPLEGGVDRLQAGLNPQVLLRVEGQGIPQGWRHAMPQTGRTASTTAPISASSG